MGRYGDVVEQLMRGSERGKGTYLAVKYPRDTRG